MKIRKGKSSFLSSLLISLIKETWNNKQKRVLQHFGFSENMLLWRDLTTDITTQASQIYESVSDVQCFHFSQACPAAKMGREIKNFVTPIFQREYGMSNPRIVCLWSLRKILPKQNVLVRWSTWCMHIDNKINARTTTDVSM